MRFIVLLSLLLLLGPAGFALAADTCSLARNNRCEEPYLGTGLCAPDTDTTDCAGGSVIPHAGGRLLSPADLRHMSRAHLRLARNEIFARQGYRFKSPDLQAFFGQRSWYRPGVKRAPTKVEGANLDRIRRAEAEGPPGGGGLARAKARGIPPTPPFSATVKWADGRTGRLHHDGGREYWFEEGRDAKRILLPASGEVYEIRKDEEFGVVTVLDLFPPASVPALLRNLDVTAGAVGKETVAGEETVKTRVDWTVGEQTLAGHVWYTADGIPMKVDVGGVYTECCGGDPGEKWSVRWELRELDRGVPDPAWFVVPKGMKWSYPG